MWDWKLEEANHPLFSFQYWWFTNKGGSGQAFESAVLATSPAENGTAIATSPGARASVAIKPRSPLTDT